MRLGGNAAITSAGKCTVATGDACDMGDRRKKGIRDRGCRISIGKGGGRTMERAAIYCRLSVEDAQRQEGKDSESIANQKELLLAYAAKKGWQVTGIYVDEDYSGLREDRPGFQKLIAHGREGRFSVILCKTQSRFTRNLVTAERYLYELFPLWGIRFVSVVDGVDTARRENKRASQINSLINEWYCEELSDNIRAVLRRKREMGQYLGNYAPYGYEKSPFDHHVLVPCSQRAQVVAGIFRLYLMGFSCGGVAAVLNGCGILSPAMALAQEGKDCGRKAKGIWTASTVCKILKNPVYLGNMVQGKTEKISYKQKKSRPCPKERWTVVCHTHAPLVSEELFEAVQKKMAKNRKT